MGQGSFLSFFKGEALGLFYVKVHGRHYEVMKSIIYMV